MNAVAAWLFGTARFVPHGFCLLWRPDLVAIHVVSDALIALAYFAIPAALYGFVRQRTDLKPAHKRMAMLFVAFILACGLTHIASIVTLWAPYYGLQALVKAATAAVSVATAAALPFLVPKLLTIPSPEALSQANGRLQSEIGAHQATLKQLSASRASLEREVAERTEDLRVANARFTAALANSQVTLSEQDADRRYTWVHNPARGLSTRDLIGRTEGEVMPADAADALGRLRDESAAAGEPRRGELRVAGSGGADAWFDVKVEPTRLRNGDPGMLTVATDITAQKQQQQHLQTVMHELNHRSKNLLTIVQSIARQTAKGLDVPELFLKQLGERLKALAHTHDVLVEEHWRSAGLGAVVEGQLRHQLATFSDRIEITGEPVSLAPEAAHYVGLAIHELGANAAKYGALSGGEGRVEVRWTALGDADGQRRLHLSWTERDGPLVAESARRGFGRTILEQLTPRAMNGTAALTLGAEGVRWTLEAPLKSPA